jgi:hypothetical protein
MMSFALTVAPLSSMVPHVEKPINRRSPGRKPKLNPEEVRVIQQAVEMGEDTKKLSKIFGVSRHRINFYGRRKS